MPPVMSTLPAACWWITVALLMAGLKVTFRPWALNKPSSSAMKKPAESTAGTTATVRSGFSNPGVPAALPPAEHPTASSVTTVTSSAVPRTRLVLISLTPSTRVTRQDAGRQDGQELPTSPYPQRNRRPAVMSRILT